MPTDHRLGLHDDQGRTPVSPRVREQHPKQSISRTEWRTLDRALEHRQLLSEGQVLKHDRAVSAADQCQRPKQKENRTQSESSCRVVERRSTGTIGDPILANDTVAVRVTIEMILTLV